MARFTDLPYDVVRALYAHIRPQDFLSLAQTCRELNALSSTDYAWRQLNISLPLIIGRNNHQSVSALRHSVVTALKIDASWMNESLPIRKQTKFMHGDFIYFVHLLKDDWLFTLSREAPSNRGYFSAWDLKARGGPRRLARIEPTHQGVSLLVTKFSATVHSNGEKVVIAAFTDDRSIGNLQFFSLSLRPKASFSPLQLEDSINVTAHPGLSAQLHDVQIYDHIIAASFTQISSQPEFYELIILDIDDQHARSITIGTKEDMAGEKFVFKLLPDSIVIITSTQDNGTASVYDLNQILRSSPPANASFTSPHGMIHDTKSLRTRYSSPLFSSFYSIHFTAEAITSVPSEIVVMAINKLSGDGHVFRLPIPKQKLCEGTNITRVEPDSSFPLFPGEGTPVENIFIGPTGHRMIWMEVIPESEDVKLMKAILPLPGDNDVMVNELLPKGGQMFKPDDCLSMWLDEAQGRVCCGLINRQICILDL